MGETIGVGEEPNPENREYRIQKIVGLIKQRLDFIEGIIDEGRRTGDQATMVNFDVESDFLPRGDVSEAEKAAVIAFLQTPEIVEVLGEDVAATGIEFVGLDELTVTIRFVLRRYEKEDSAETVRLRFSQKCAYCKHEIIVEADVSKSLAGKIKKDKKTQRKYRDWDYPEEIECPQCLEQGVSHKAQLYYREWDPQE